jgi:hypothetical protein
VNLERVGLVADIPADASPIQLGTEGIYGGKSFQVVGRIVYEYEQGRWNEWHLIFNEGSSGWLSDAQLEYAVSFLAQPPVSLPAETQVKRGSRFDWNGRVYEVTTVTRAHYVGVDGELPFEYWDKQEVLFADLRTPDSRFGTIDYSEATPLLFLGEAVEYEHLRLNNVRQFEGWS